MPEFSVSGFGIGTKYRIGTRSDEFNPERQTANTECCRTRGVRTCVAETQHLCKLLQRMGLAEGPGKAKKLLDKCFIHTYYVY